MKYASHSISARYLSITAPTIVHKFRNFRVPAILVVEKARIADAFFAFFLFGKHEPHLNTTTYYENEEQPDNRERLPE